MDENIFEYFFIQNILNQIFFLKNYVRLISRSEINKASSSESKSSHAQKDILKHVKGKKYCGIFFACLLTM